MVYPPIPDWWELPPLAIEDAPPKRARVNTPPPPGPSRAAHSQQLVRTKIKRNPSGVAEKGATHRKQSKRLGQIPGRTAEDKLDYLLKQKEKQKKGSKKDKPPRNDGMMQLDDGMLQLPPSDGTNPFTLFRLGN